MVNYRPTVTYRLTWGHEMVLMQVAGAYECKWCGTHSIDSSPCPHSATCDCLTSRQKSGFTLAGFLGIPVYVCGDCGLPTEQMLVAAIRECGLEV